LKIEDLWSTSGGSIFSQPLSLKGTIDSYFFFTAELAESAEKKCIFFAGAK
jgi:hypothetical protein